MIENLTMLVKYFFTERENIKKKHVIKQTLMKEHVRIPIRNTQAYRHARFVYPLSLKAGKYSARLLVHTIYMCVCL